MLFYIHVIVITGSAQVNLTRNSSHLITCPGETAAFTCTVSTPSLLWTVPTYFEHDQEFLNDPTTIGRSVRNDFGPSNAITIHLAGAQPGPLTTVMVVQENLINQSFRVECTAQSHLGDPLTSDSETEEYIPACELFNGDELVHKL